VVTFVVVGKSALDLHSGTVEREAAMVSHLQMVTAMQSKALAGPLWDYNVEQVRSILDGLGREKSFVQATVIGADGKVVAEAPDTSKNAAGLADKGAALGRVWSIEAPSVLEDGARHETVGMLRVTYSRRALDDAWLHQIVLSAQTTAAVALVTAAAVLLSLRLLTRPLQALTVAMGQLAAGDTSVPVAATGRRDEIGRMARAVDVFKQNMITADQLAAEQAAARGARSRRQDARERDTEAFGTSVSAVMSRLSGSADEMRSVAEAMTQAAATVHQAATSTSDGAVKSSQALATTAAAVEELTSSFAEIARQVRTAADVSRQAVQRADASQSTIRGLAEATARIGDVVKLINNIASQTNLLALNATIEAARAGDAGKGFAVVAGEVKALAAQTARATAEIASQIDTVRGVTEQTLAAMTEIGAIIGKMDEVSSAIETAVEEQNVTTREIATSVQTVSGATAQSAQAMGQVVVVASQAGTASQKLLDGVAGIGQETGTLRTEVERFLVTVRTDSAGRRRFEQVLATGVKANLILPGQNVMQVAVTDLSEDGAEFQCNHPIASGTELSFELPETGGPVAGKVIRVESGGIVAIAFRDDDTTRSQVTRAMSEHPQLWGTHAAA
jgi:methyl-accepting chemotaxis protein